MPRTGLNDSFFDREPFKSYRERAVEYVNKDYADGYERSCTRQRDSALSSGNKDYPDFMGVDIRDFTGEYYITMRENIRKAKIIAQRVPDRYRGMYDKLVDAYERLTNERMRNNREDKIIANMQQLAYGETKRIEAELQNTGSFFKRRSLEKKLTEAERNLAYLDEIYDRNSVEESVNKKQEKLELMLMAVENGAPVVQIPAGTDIDWLDNQVEQIYGKKKYAPIHQKDYEAYEKLFSEELGMDTQQVVRAISEISRGLKPFENVIMDVQESVEGLAESVMKAESPADLSVNERAFAVHNFNRAFENIFTAYEKNLPENKMGVYFEGGRKNVSDMTEDDKVKVVMSALKGERVVVLDGNNEPSVLKITSDIEAIRSAVEKNSEILRSSAVISDRYYTVNSEIEGVGRPVIAEGAEKKGFLNDGNKKLGGTFTALEVSEDVRNSMLESKIPDCVYFEKGEKPGHYVIKPKFPELGCPKGGADIPESWFHIRNNMNYINKGIAGFFINDDGGVDFEKGRKRTDRLASLISQENYEAAGEMLNIPPDERKDFARFARAEETGFHNLFSIWDKFVASAKGFALAMEDPDISPEHVELVEKERGNFENAVRELKELAAIDPKSEMRMWVQNECSGSAAFNKTLIDLSRNTEGNRAVQEDKEKIEDAYVAGFDAYEDRIRKEYDSCLKDAQVSEGYIKRELLDRARYLEAVMSEKKINTTENEKIKVTHNNCVDILEKIDGKSIEEMRKIFADPRNGIKEITGLEVSANAEEKRRMAEIRREIDRISDDAMGYGEELFNKKLEETEEGSPQWQQLMDNKESIREELISRSLRSLSEEFVQCESEAKRKEREEVENIRDAITAKRDETYQQMEERGIYNVERKWDFHQAGKVFDFTHKGEKYSVTFEAFAPLANEIHSHPGATKNVMTGIYRNREEFKWYYSKDKENIPTDEAVKYKKLIERYDEMGYEKDPLVYYLPEEKTVKKAEAVKKVSLDSLGTGKKAQVKVQPSVSAKKAPERKSAEM